MSNGRIRNKKVFFTQVSNEALRDNSLSLKAKGLYALIQSYVTIEDFILYKNFLMKQCKEGKDGFQSAWGELIKKGYLLQFRVRNEKGVFSYEYELLDSPEPPKAEDKPKEDEENHGESVSEPDTENPHTENPHTAEPHTEKQGDIIKTNSKNTNKKNTNSKKTKSSSSNNVDKSKNKSTKNEDEEDRYLPLYKKCSSNNVVISLEELETLFELYDGIKVLRAIEKALVSARSKTIRQGYNYIATIIDNDSKSNTTNININNEKKVGFNNFTQRERTQEEYDDLENKLLGWY